ncbi:MAG: arginase family protein [Hyphomicrobiaceae bacterium]
MPKPLAVVDAPSNLGLRPPDAGLVPGVYKLAGALRDQRLLERLGARDAGVVTPPRYDPAPGAPGETRNSAAIATYSRRLADRVSALLDRGEMPIVLGGDCSILLGPLAALRARGRYGLAFIDGHTDFRHPGNSDTLHAAAGEDLALATGRGDARLTALGAGQPLVHDEDIAVIGFRRDDPAFDELRPTKMLLWPIFWLYEHSRQELDASLLRRFDRTDLDGIWIHLDVDALDPRVMPAVDSPAPDGLSKDELVGILRTLLGTGKVTGIDVTIYDPDLDADGRCAGLLTDILVEAFKVISS